MGTWTFFHFKSIQKENKLVECCSTKISQSQGSPQGRVKHTTKGTLLFEPPKIICRPLTLIDGHSYAATWDSLKQNHNGKITHNRCLRIVCNDGQYFSDEVGLPLSDLDMEIKLPEIPENSHLWSTLGASQYTNGHRANAKDVFQRLTVVIDRFVDFSHSLASQSIMCELIACYIMATYFLDAFDVFGYLCVNGVSGSGKSTLIQLMTKLAYLGYFTTTGSTFAAVRDLADYGGTIAFDDAETLMRDKTVDPRLRALFLAGSHKGASVPLKESIDGQWRTKHVNAFCPRLFNAIKRPEGILASRSIIIPLVKSTNKQRTAAKLSRSTNWPHKREELIDDLWNIGLANLPDMPAYNEEAERKARLLGRNIEPWEPVLTIALWLTREHQIDGLFDRLERLSVDYQQERETLEDENPVRLLILALDQMFSKEPLSQQIIFATRDLTEKMNLLAINQGFTMMGESFTNEKRVGKKLSQLRVFKPATRTAKGTRWQVRRDDLMALAVSYSVPLGTQAPQEGLADALWDALQSEARGSS